jgi:hypothetical protein
MTDEQQPFSVEDQPVEEMAVFTDDDAQQQVMVGTEQGLAAAPESSTPRFSLMALWENVRRAFFPTYSERTEQLHRRITRLTRAIELSPETPTNYVLRGELYLELGDDAAASIDFQHALDLAIANVEQEDWGVIAQVIQDRAQDGLAAAHRHKL